MMPANEARPQVGRSRIPKVVGVLLCIGGVFGLISSLPGLLQMLLAPTVLVLMGKYALGLVALVISGVFLSGWLIFIGIELIRYRDRGRRQFLYFAAIFLIVSFVSGFLLQGLQQHPYITLGDASSQGVRESLGSPLRLVPLVLILFLVGFLLNREKVKKSLK